MAWKSYHLHSASCLPRRRLGLCFRVTAAHCVPVGVATVALLLLLLLLRIHLLIRCFVLCLTPSVFPEHYYYRLQPLKRLEVPPSSSTSATCATHLDCYPLP